MLSTAERVYCMHFVSTGDKHTAMLASGLVGSDSSKLDRAEVKKEIKRLESEYADTQATWSKLKGDAARRAVERLIEILDDDTAPAMAQVKAAAEILDRAGFTQ